MRTLVTGVTTLGADLAGLKSSVQGSARSLSAAMTKIEAAIEVPQSVRELVQTLRDVPPAIRTAFDGLSYTSLISVFLAIDHARLPKYSWVYFPHPENGPQNLKTVALP